MKKRFALLLVCGLAFVAQIHAANNCIVTGTTYLCLNDASVGLNAIPTITAQCISTAMTVATGTNWVPTKVRATTSYSNCSALLTTNVYTPTLSNYRWVVSGVLANPQSGTGLTATFTPTRAGAASITFSVDWTLGADPTPCTYYVNQTVSLAANFTVFEVAS